MIEVENLSKSLRGHEVLDELNFHIKTGERVALIGLRGSGKSTLLQILCGYSPPSRGDIRIASHSISSQASQAKSQLGYAPREAPLYPELSVTSYLKLCQELRDLHTPKPAIEPILANFGLDHWAHHKIDILSTGLRQQLNLAQALLHQPKILLMDDIFNDLDLLESGRLQNILLEQSRNKTFLLATHDLTLAQQLCDRAIILDKGKVRYDGPLSTSLIQMLFTDEIQPKEHPNAGTHSSLAP